MRFGPAVKEQEVEEGAVSMAQEKRKKTAGVLPPDGGWGWMIVAGCFMVTVCTRAVTR